MHTGYLQLDRCVPKVGSVHCGALLSTRYQFAPITVTTRNDSRHWQMSPGETNPFPGTSPIYETMKKMWLPSQGYKPQSVFPQAASLATPEGRNVMRWSRGFICVSEPGAKASSTDVVYDGCYEQGAEKFVITLSMIIPASFSRKHWKNWEDPLSSTQ